MVTYDVIMDLSLLIPDVHPRDDTVPSYCGNKESSRIVYSAKSALACQAPHYGTPTGKCDLHTAFPYYISVIVNLETEHTVDNETF